jgi:hypothetical protein
LPRTMSLQENIANSHFGSAKLTNGADLESEMPKRGMTFDLIDWSDQAEQPTEG